MKGKIYLLGINGSPRPKGNTQFLLDEALDEAKKAASEWNETVMIENYSAAAKVFLPCTGCRRCYDLKYCARTEEPGDDFSGLMKQWLKADAVLLAVPVYHMNMPGNIVNFIDRLGASARRPYGSNVKFMKIYGCISQGCDLFSGQEHTLMSMINHALITGNVCVSGDLPENYIGAAGWTEVDPSLSTNSLRKNYERKHVDAQFAVKAARSQGRRTIQLALMLKMGAIKYLDRLRKERAYSPLVERLEKNDSRSTAKSKN